jgi:predicted MFS family arabinose efflux permease
VWSSDGSWAAHQLGAASAASFAGLIRAHEGSYDPAFMISGGLCLVTAAAIWVLRPRRQRAQPVLDDAIAL